MNTFSSYTNPIGINTMNDNIPDLKIEMMNDGHGDGLILLEQDSGGNIDRVAIHPIHLRYMAEKMGLLESSDPTAQKTIATLQRRMISLRDRIENLSDWMAEFSDHRHADLSYETNQLDAMADLAREWCCDFEEPEPAANRASLITVMSDKPADGHASLSMVDSDMPAHREKKSVPGTDSSKTGGEKQVATIATLFRLEG